jgi:outer membrane protein TolC
MNNYFKPTIQQHLSVYAKFFLAAIILFFEASQSIHAQKQLSLKEAVVTTIHNNRRVRIDSAASGIIQERTRLEKGALLPKVEFNTQTGHYSQQPVAFNTAINTGEAGQIGYLRPGGKDVASADLSMEIPLLNVQQHKKIEAGKLEQQQYSFKAKVTKIDLRAEVKQTYLLILTLQKRMLLYHKNRERNNKALQDARYLFFHGKVPEEDTLRLYLACRDQEPDLLKLQNEIQAGKQHINLLMGVELKKDIVLTDTITYDSSINMAGEEQIFQKAKAIKPSIKILELEEEIADKDAEAARSSAFPVVKALGQYSVQTQTNEFNYSKGLYPSTAFVGIRITVPIIAGHSVHSKNKISLLESSQAKFKQQVAWKVLAADISKITGDIKETGARINIQAVVVQAAQKNYDRILYKYELGQSAKLDVLDALSTLSQAESNLIESGYNFELAMIELEKLQAEDVEIL